MNAEVIDEVADIPLDQLDVSQASLFQNDTWRPYFARLRREAPVHFLEDSLNGPFWSVSNWPLIKEVDTNHQIFSSAEGIAIARPLQSQSQAGIEVDQLTTLEGGGHDLGLVLQGVRQT